MKLKLVVILMAGAATLAMADGASQFAKCAVCHGEHAEKKSLGVSAVIAGWKADKVIERLKGYKAGTLNQYGYGNMMGGQATKLNDAQMKEVAHYISTLTPPPVVAVDDNATDEILTPEQMAHKQFLRDYFIKNPKYGNIREANRLWEEKKLKEKSTK